MLFKLFSILIEASLEDKKYAPYNSSPIGT